MVRYCSVVIPCQGMLTRLSVVRVAALLALVLSFACTAAVPRSTDETALVRLDKVQKQLQAARKAQDWPAFLASARALKEILHGSPDSVLLLARAYARNDDVPSALSELALYIDMGQTSEQLAKSEEFSVLKENPDFQKLQLRMKTNSTSVDHSHPVAELTSLTGQIAEDIDYDPRTKLFYLTSVLGKSIVSVDPEGHSKVFAILAFRLADAGAQNRFRASHCVGHGSRHRRFSRRV